MAGEEDENRWNGWFAMSARELNRIVVLSPLTQGRMTAVVVAVLEHALPESLRISAPAKNPLGCRVTLPEYFASLAKVRLRLAELR